MKNRISIFILVNILILVPCSILLGQVDTLWTRTYGGSNGDDRGKEVQQTIDGGYIIVGQTNSFGVGEHDIWIIKTNFSGDTLWTKTYGGNMEDYGYSVQETTDSGYIIVGYTDSFGSGNEDVWLIKTDSSGDTIWTKTFGGSNSDMGYSVRQTSDEGYILVGVTGSFGTGYSNVWLIKTDSSGDTLWTKTYGGNMGNYGHSVKQTTDGGYIIAGSTDSFGSGESDVWLIKTDSFGDTIWTKTYGGSSWDDGYSVQQTTDGGYIITGRTKSFAVAGTDDIWLIKTNSSGDTLWTNTFGGSDYEYGRSVWQTTDGGYIICGWSAFSAVWLIKTDSSGNAQWIKTFGGSAGGDGGWCVQQTTDGGYVIVGTIYPFISGNNDVWLLKTTSEITEIESNSYLITSYFALSQNYPNPFNPSTEISWQSPVDSWQTLKIYDVLGNEVSTLVDEYKPAGKYEVEFNSSSGIRDLVSGIYFYQLKTGNYIETKKMVLLK